MFVIWLVCLGSAAVYSSVDADTVVGGRCSVKRPPSYLNTISNVENLNFDKQVSAVLERGQQKRYSIQLNTSSPLFINISGSVGIVKRLYFNQTINLSRHIKINSKEIFLPCATNGLYDLVLISKRKSLLVIEATDRHPSLNWPLLNISALVRIRYQNRMQKRQMVVKWSKSKLDIHAMHYCLVINTRGPKINFCESVRESLDGSLVKASCSPHSIVENVWMGQGDRVKKIDPAATNVVCTGSKTQQILRGLLPNIKYYIDIFGVHTKLRNLTFLLKSGTAWFNRTHPNHLVENSLTIGKISGMTGVSVFSYKIPQSTKNINSLRFLVLPCGGSQIDVKFLKQKQKLKMEKDIYRPTYITLPNINPGDRFIVRVNPSNEDEILKANKVGLAVTTLSTFSTLPELPGNTSLFEIRSFRNCRSPTIAWYSSPETRRFRYCVIVFSAPNSNRSSVDQTNYCTEFGKKVTSHPQFYRVRCFESNKREIERFTVLNLLPGDSYLIYVTVNLFGGRALPYESLKINVSKHCQNELEDNVLWKNSSFYDN